jgi:branched-subunit amino acid ABC-type transport system permease component
LNAFVAAYLAQDGLSNGAIYCLLALALVLVFAVTRVILIPQGDFVSYAAISFVSLRDGRVPGTVGLLLVLTALTLAIELARSRDRIGPRALRLAAGPLLLAALAAVSPRLHLPAVLDAILATALVAALGPLLYRIVYRRIASATTLVLLIVSVALHFVMLGMGLYFFGPEGVRAEPLIDLAFTLGSVPVKGQSLLILATCAVLALALFGIGERSLIGKAMRAAAINPTGARLMGISAEWSGGLAFLVAALIGAVSGVLISSTTTLYYDSGFLLGLKGFVAGILGGLASFPLAGAGAFMLGLLESFASFYASAFKETIVFSLIIPILLWRSLAARPGKH